jgi:hypothetical protein
MTTMGLQDRDYMRSARQIRRASDQRSPGDPRSADDVFLPGTVHARPRRRIRTVIVVASVLAGILIGLVYL